MSKYVVEDEDYSRHIWRDTSRPLGEPDEDGTITYASAEPYEVEGYMEGLESQLAEREGEVALFRALLERASACLDLRSWRHLYDEIEAALTPAPKPEGEEKTHE